MEHSKKEKKEINWDAVMVVSVYVLAALLVLSYSPSFMYAIIFLVTIGASSLMLHPTTAMQVTIGIVAVSYVMNFIGSIERV